MASQFSTNLNSLTTKTIVPGIKTLHPLPLIAMALFLFVGAAHAQLPEPCASLPIPQPCVLVSDILTGQVEVWPDAGNYMNGLTVLNANFLNPPTCTGTGQGGGGEGLSCVAGSTNRLYTVTRGPSINTFNLTNGCFVSQFQNNSSDEIGVITVEGAGHILYAGQGNVAQQGIYSLNASSAGVSLGAYTLAPLAGSVALGTCPATNPDCGNAGSVFADYGPTMDSGINEYMASGNADMMLTPPPPIQFLPGITSGTPCDTFGAAGYHCWYNVGGMAFDSYGNLWVNNNTTPNDTGTFEFAPGGTCDAPVCPLNYTPDQDGDGAGAVGVTIAPLSDPANPGYVMVANYLMHHVYKISPMSCTGSTLTTPWTLGTCTETLFITDIYDDQGDLGRPKRVDYPQACPNPDNNGYVEICKAGNTEFPPPPGLYDFTATAPFFSSGTIQVPLGECSGAIQAPSGQVTLTEAPTIGTLVSDVTACSYDLFGQCVPDLISWTPPDLYATVPVNAGGISEETLATFTNYAASPGQLKVCKIAGTGTPVGTQFTFTVTGLPPFPLEAGPADQGGFCALAGTFPVNTPVTIAETPNPPYTPTSITVSQGQLSACQPPSNYCTVATIGAGITVVSFTNTEQGKTVTCLACNR